jgi:hypothetical protein
VALVDVLGVDVGEGTNSETPGGRDVGRRLEVRPGGELRGNLGEAHVAQLADEGVVEEDVGGLDVPANDQVNVVRAPLLKPKDFAALYCERSVVGALDFSANRGRVTDFFYCCTVKISQPGSIPSVPKSVALSSGPPVFKGC